MGFLSVRHWINLAYTAGTPALIHRYQKFTWMMQGWLGLGGIVRDAKQREWEENPYSPTDHHSGGSMKKNSYVVLKELNMLIHHSESFSTKAEKIKANIFPLSLQLPWFTPVIIRFSKERFSNATIYLLSFWMTEPLIC